MFMEYNKPFFEKVFSNKRMERYFRLYEDEKKTIDRFEDTKKRISLRMNWNNE